MTFTRKAAAEMRSRIVEAIEDADSTTPPRNAVHARTRQLAQWAARHAADREWELERNPSRLRILTIDGLNRQLAAATPIAAGGDFVGDLLRRPADRRNGEAVCQFYDRVNLYCFHRFKYSYYIAE